MIAFDVAQPAMRPMFALEVAPLRPMFAQTLRGCPKQRLRHHVTPFGGESWVAQLPVAGGGSRPCRSRDPGCLTLNGPVCAKRVCGTRVDRLKRGGWSTSVRTMGELTPQPPAEAPIAMPFKHLIVGPGVGFSIVPGPGLRTGRAPDVATCPHQSSGTEDVTRGCCTFVLYLIVPTTGS